MNNIAHQVVSRSPANRIKGKMYTACGEGCKALSCPLLCQTIYLSPVFADWPQVSKDPQDAGGEPGISPCKTCALPIHDGFSSKDMGSRATFSGKEKVFHNMPC